MTEAQCDTLSIPGLEVKSSCLEMKDLPVAYRLGYFQDNALLHPEITVHPFGFSTTHLPYRLLNDNWVNGTILFCFVILAYVIKLNGPHLLGLLRNLLYPYRRNELTAVKTTIEKQTSVFMTLLMCLIGGLGSFYYIQNGQDLFFGLKSPYVLLGLYVGFWVGYFVLKNLLSTFINWIFFDKESQSVWRDCISALIALETVLLFFVIVVFVYFNMEAKITLLSVFIVVLIVKGLRLYKTFQIFFREKYGSLQLFMYFCTLELFPLMVAVRFLMQNTEELIVKY